MIKRIFPDIAEPKIHSHVCLKSILRDVSKQVGIPPHVIKSRSRKSEHVQARKMYIERAVKKTSDLIYIMSFINRDRTSFYTYMHK